MSSFLSISVALLVSACAGCTARALDAGNSGPDGSSIVFVGRDGGEAGLGPITTGDGADRACTEGQDQTCNDDLQQSSFAGKCEGGRCNCRAGSFIVPGGKCRSAKGIGAGCSNTSECYAGLECLEFAVHPPDGGCSVVAKQCTSSCNDATKPDHCSGFLGPGIRCFAGCAGSDGICGQTP